MVYHLESRWLATPSSLGLSCPLTFGHLLGVASYLLSLRCKKCVTTPPDTVPWLFSTCHCQQWGFKFFQTHASTKRALLLWFGNDHFPKDGEMCLSNNQMLAPCSNCRAFVSITKTLAPHVSPSPAWLDLHLLHRGSALKKGWKKHQTQERWRGESLIQTDTFRFPHSSSIFASVSRGALCWDHSLVAHAANGWTAWSCAHLHLPTNSGGVRGWQMTKLDIHFMQQRLLAH